jgi:hypothetical protein
MSKHHTPDLHDHYTLAKMEVLTWLDTTKITASIHVCISRMTMVRILIPLRS